jgi:hypothetical protein
MSSSFEKQVLVRGLGVAVGECLFAMAGPFLFQRFGLNIPESAAVGCLLGAGVGFGVVDRILHLRKAQMGVSIVHEITRPEVPAGLDDVGIAGLSGSIDSDPTRRKIQTALSRFAERDFDKIRVEVRNGKVVLKGRVHSWIDEAEAERIVFDLPGIQEVENRLQVVP